MGENYGTLTLTELNIDLTDLGLDGCFFGGAKIGATSMQELLGP